MAEQQERIYEWEVARIGDESPPITIEVTAEAIKEYARVCRYENPVYTDVALAGRSEYGGLVAPPGMVFAFAPMRRDQAIAAAGYIAPEQAKVSPRTTPYVASQILLLKPVRAGDRITSTTKTNAKYERRGNRYIDFLITAQNQRGEKVAEYIYTCLWHYVKGQRLRQAQAPPASS
ncbi:MAG: MaoC family dehydratase N-terminal domain-containing protein [Chloroflexi bacterium]|nr:MaoC family dehydratase N-terminal domain-containing protein [Chloroflexota bacterium]